MRRSTVLAVALMLDLAFGEPPAAIHPVVWFGRLAALLERQARRGRPTRELTSGATLTLTSLITAWLTARGAEAFLDLVSRQFTLGATPRLGASSASRLAGATTLLVEAWLLKTMLSLRALTEAASVVQQALTHDDIAAARLGLRSLVSRDASALDAPLVAAAAIESVAENAGDSLVAPALAYTAFGLPGAAVYRGVNTLDAMIGYRGAYEWFGKSAAWLDDAANLIPSRLTAVLLALAVGPGRGRSASRIAWRDQGRTVSPNAGWPMGAMAGALGVELEKIGHYRLGVPARLPDANDVGTAIVLVRRVAVLTVVLVNLAEKATRRRQELQR